MKRFILLLFVFTITRGHGQNEFAATSFYKEFNKIHADAETGFVLYKGEKRKPGIDSLAEEYKVKLILPLADSGKIVFPPNANPYAEYYFQTSKSREEIDQRAVNLREAMLTAYAKPLYARTETITIKKNTYSDTYFYTHPDQTNTSQALFHSRIYNDKNKYYLCFRIRGKIVAAQ